MLELLEAAVRLPSEKICCGARPSVSSLIKKPIFCFKAGFRSFLKWLLRRAGGVADLRAFGFEVHQAAG